MRARARHCFLVGPLTVTRHVLPSCQWGLLGCAGFVLCFIPATLFMIPTGLAARVTCLRVHFGIPWGSAVAKDPRTRKSTRTWIPKPEHPRAAFLGLFLRHVDASGFVLSCDGYGKADKGEVWRQPASQVVLLVIIPRIPAQRRPAIRVRVPKTLNRGPRSAHCRTPRNGSGAPLHEAVWPRRRGGRGGSAVAAQES